MNPNLSRAAATSLLAAACSLAIAQQPKIAPQGSATYVTYYTTQALGALEMGEAGAGALLQFTGVTRNPDGARVFDNMSVRCLAYREALGGKVQVSGSCVEIDTEGDKVFTTFAGGVHTIVGGSGKYKGISGTAPFTFSVLPSPGTGLGAMAVEHRVSWQIK